MIGKLASWYSIRSRKRRANTFISILSPSNDDKILDLGSEDGSHIARIIPFRDNVYIADICKDVLVRGKDKYGFHTILLDETGMIPYPNDFFDIVYSSSVIEHVTVDKANVYNMLSTKEFQKKAISRQRRFAEEIRRVGKAYFVQTPYKYFPIESHTWTPFVIVFFPRRFQIALIKFVNRFWPKKTNPDWNLLSIQQMKQLFPDSEIITEKSLGLIKSIMAIRKRTS